MEVSVEEVASAVEKRTEALISAAVQVGGGNRLKWIRITNRELPYIVTISSLLPRQDVLLTVQQIMNPLQSKINRCERTTKKIATLQVFSRHCNAIVTPF